MLRERDEGLTNLLLLRDVVWPEVERRAGRGLLDFDYYERFDGCRTFLCLLGTCCEHPVMRGRGFSLDRERFASILIVTPRYRGLDIRGGPPHGPTPGFGLSADADRALFGNDAAGGTLADRRRLLDHLIESREQVL